MDDENQGLLPLDLGRLVRRQWHDGRWFLSVVDVVAVLTENDTPRRYWSDLKRKLHAEGFESYEKIVQLKMRSLDGKSYATDAADIETMLRIIQSIPSPKAEPFKQWLARVGSERLEDTASTDLLAGMSEDQRRLFLRGQVADRNLTLAETAQSAGVLTTRAFALFQDEGYRGLYDGETSRDIASRKGLGKGQQILDWMGPEELADNLFRQVQAGAKLKRDGVTTRDGANRTHFEAGQVVRQAIAALGGVMPEDLDTPTESIQDVQRREQLRQERERRPFEVIK